MTFYYFIIIINKERFREILKIYFLYIYIFFLKLKFMLGMVDYGRVDI